MQRLILALNFLVGPSSLNLQNPAVREFIPDQVYQRVQTIFTSLRHVATIRTLIVNTTIGTASQFVVESWRSSANPISYRTTGVSLGTVRPSLPRGQMRRCSLRIEIPTWALRIRSLRYYWKRKEPQKRRAAKNLHLLPSHRSCQLTTVRLRIPDLVLVQINRGRSSGCRSRWLPEHALGKCVSCLEIS